MSMSAPPATDSPGGPPAAVPQPRPQSGIRRPIAVAIVAAAVVLGIVTIWAATRLGADTLPTGPALPPPVPTPVGLQFDQDTRRAWYDNVQVTLAGSPYICALKPEPSGPFDEALPCSYSVHEFYSGSSSWTADTGLALAPASITDADDVQATAKAILDRTLATAYPKGSTVSKLEVGPYAGQYDAAVLSAHVNVSVPKLPTTFDAVVIVVLTAKDGQQVVFYSYRPNDADEQALKTLQDSANTLTRS